MAYSKHLGTSQCTNKELLLLFVKSGLIKIEERNFFVIYQKISFIFLLTNTRKINFVVNIMTVRRILLLSVTYYLT